jgi:DNA-binding transcriptional MerR regulator
MLYTVKEVSELSNVTIKTLHHYHKIGLLLPRQVSEAGYRLYGAEELERLQHILFYKELDFSLEQIKEMLGQPADRLVILSRQEQLMLGRKQRLDLIIQTLRKSITSIREGTTMNHQDMFKGFTNEKEWNEALAGQNEHLQQAYGMEPMQVAAADLAAMNEQAAEAMTFMNRMADSLRDGVKHNDEQIAAWIREHLDFLNQHGHPSSAQDFADQTRFFLNDDFHLQMLEAQQTGLAYYVAAAAQSFASLN